MAALDIVQASLDVLKCLFIICYEFDSSEISAIQSRGRVRTEKSCCL